MAKEKFEHLIDILRNQRPDQWTKRYIGHYNAESVFLCKYYETRFGGFAGCDVSIGLISNPPNRCIYGLTLQDRSNIAHFGDEKEKQMIKNLYESLEKSVGQITGYDLREYRKESMLTNLLNILGCKWSEE